MEQRGTAGQRHWRPQFLPCDPVFSQSAPCNLMFFPPKDLFEDLPRGQRLWWPELHVSSFIRGKQPGWSGSRPSVRSLLRVATPLLTPRSFSYALVGPVWTSCSLGRYMHFIAFAHTDNVIVDLVFSHTRLSCHVPVFWQTFCFFLQYFFSVFVPVDS